MPSLRRRSARTARGSSPGVTTRRRRSGTRRRGAEVLTLKGHTGAVTSASFSPDGSRIVTGSRRQDGEGLGRQEWCRGPHPQGAHRCRHFGVVQPGRVADRHRESRQDGEGLGREDVVPRSSPSRGTPVPSRRRRSARTARGSSPASDDKTAKVWDATSGAEVLTLKGHTGCVRSASFSPDGSRVVTGSDDKTAKVWDAKSGAEVLTLKGHTGCRQFGVVQPGRVADRHRESRQDGEGLGREEWCRGPHPQGAHRSRLFGVVQPGRLADRHRRVGTRRRRSGTRRVVPRSSPSRGTPAASLRRRSARTARGSSPGVGTGRRRSGTRTPINREFLPRDLTSRPRAVK